jgi:enoyl-CoA hydratase/carnithine racemase
MLLTGLPIGAEEALQAGLVSRLVAEEEVEQEVGLRPPSAAHQVERICAAIGSKPRGVVALGKRFYQKQVRSQWRPRPLLARWSCP